MLIKAYILADVKTREVSDVYKFILSDEVSNQPQPSVSFTLAYLKGSIQKEIPQFEQRLFNLYFKDEDDDLVHIHTDKCLQLFLAGTNVAEVIKLYLEPLGLPSASIHPHIECDGCNKNPIVGPRFKCLQCQDYDLCVDCERAGVHMNHSMVRLAAPVLPDLHKPFSRYLKRRFLAQCSRPSQNCEETSGEEEPMECPFMDEEKKRRRCKGEEKRHHHGRHGDPSKHGHGDHSRHGRNRSCRVNWGDLVNQYTGVASAAASAAARTASAAAAHATSDPSNVEFLRSIGQTVAKLLDPLGIDVDIEMRPKNNLNEDTQKSAETTTQQKEGASMSKVNENLSQNEGTTSNIPPEAIATFNAIPLSAINLAQHVQQITEALSQQHVGESTEPGWTVIGNDSRDNSPNPSAPAPSHISQQNESTTVPTQQLYPDLTPPPATRTPHPDPKIEAGIQLLLAMGFSNETGLLTEILQIHNGDVMKAVDILAAIRR